MIDPKYAAYASRYSFPLSDDPDAHYTVAKTGNFDADTWGIWNRSGLRLSRSKHFAYEPSNSSKTDRYIHSHTFTLAEALPIAEKLARKGSGRAPQ